jgi:hypothetical protein
MGSTDGFFELYKIRRLSGQRVKYELLSYETLLHRLEHSTAISSVGGYCALKLKTVCNKFCLLIINKLLQRQDLLYHVTM